MNRNSFQDTISCYRRRTIIYLYTPTFLQIYIILAFFGILKPPRSGNCSIPDTPTKPLISISKLKEIYKSEIQNNETVVAGLEIN